MIIYLVYEYEAGSYTDWVAKAFESEADAEAFKNNPSPYNRYIDTVELTPSSSSSPQCSSGIPGDMWE